MNDKAVQLVELINIYLYSFVNANTAKCLVTGCPNPHQPFFFVSKLFPKHMLLLFLCLILILIHRLLHWKQLQQSVVWVSEPPSAILFCTFIST